MFVEQTSATPLQNEINFQIFCARLNLSVYSLRLGTCEMRHDATIARVDLYCQPIGSVTMYSVCYFCINIYKSHIVSKNFIEHGKHSQAKSTGCVLFRPGPTAKTTLPTAHCRWNLPMPALYRRSWSQCRGRGV